jgi:hypothetical protein
MGAQEVSADPHFATRDELIELRREMTARFDRLEDKLDALSERVTEGRERSAEWSVRAFLVIGAAAATTFFGQLFGA